MANRWMLLQRLDDARLKAGGRLTRHQLAVAMVEAWADDADQVARSLVGLPSRVTTAKVDAVPEGLRELLELGLI